MKKSNHVAIFHITAFRGFVLPAGLITALALTASSAAAKDIETVTVTGQRSAPDLCLTVATAKVRQWAQERIHIRETRTFASGKTSKSEAIFTHNAAYGHRDGNAWNAIQYIRQHRRNGSPRAMEKTMSLNVCHRAGPAKQNGMAATLYTYSYEQDRSGNETQGRVWIADASGLPLRQEMTLTSNAGNQKMPTNIVAQYSYNDAVKVPTLALQAQNARRHTIQQNFREMQMGQPSGSF